MASSTADYDDTNIFAKIIKGEVPCHKVFENRYALAILDAFPVTKGHVVLMPKRLGNAKDLSEMGPRSVCDLTSCIPLLCKAIKGATGCEAINVVSNLGANAGQTVFHPHIHLIPRQKDDGLVKLGASAKEMLETERAQEILGSIISNIEEHPFKAKAGEEAEAGGKRGRKGKGKAGKREALKEKREAAKKEEKKGGRTDKKGSSDKKEEKPERKRRERKGRGKAPSSGELAKAEWVNVADVKPEGDGANLRVKYLGLVPTDKQDKTEKTRTFATHYFGDETGTVIVSARKEESYDVDKTYEIRNFKTLMTKSGFLRVFVDKWGKVGVSEEKKVGKVNAKVNVSEVEYEKVD